ncbi:MAG: C_GCAxxG_C_C family protein [Chloroflexi bacterium]|nr:C_GCAxxG_C_C family protein [Chloroflexota bacterium]
MTSTEIELRAFEYFQSGFHCAESILLAIVETYEKNPSSRIPKAAAGFMGGIGGTHEEACGALTGGIIAIGCLFGRTDPETGVENIKKLASEYRRRFIQEFGATKCQILLDEFDGQKDGLKCKRLTATATGILSELLTTREQ